MRALYAGTFDPFTNGHQDILERALDIFEEITILVAKSPTKRAILDTETRVKIIKEIFKGNKKIRVDYWEGLTVDYAKKEKIGVIIRGLRPTGDFENEFQMASMNRKIYPDVETVFLTTSGEHYYLSSTLVREIFYHGRDISEFVHPIVIKTLTSLKEKNK